jgi:hypothetical protein
MNLEDSFIKHCQNGDISSMKKIYLNNDISIDSIEDSFLLAYDLGYLDIVLWFYSLQIIDFKTIKDRLIEIYQKYNKEHGTLNDMLMATFVMAIGCHNNGLGDSFSNTMWHKFVWEYRNTCICNPSDNCFCDNYKGNIKKMINILLMINGSINLRKTTNKKNLCDLFDNRNILRRLVLEKDINNNSIKRYSVK